MNTLRWKDMDILTKFATLKVYAQRSMLYYQLINSAMIILIYTEQKGLGVGWQVILLIVAVVSILVIGYYDTFFKILQKEQAHFSKENLFVQDMLSSQKEISERLKNIEKHLKIEIDAL